MKRPKPNSEYIVQRLENGSRQEHSFRTLTAALNFIRSSRSYSGFELYKPIGKRHEGRRADEA